MDVKELKLLASQRFSASRKKLYIIQIIQMLPFTSVITTLVTSIVIAILTNTLNFISNILFGDSEKLASFISMEIMFYIMAVIVCTAVYPIMTLGLFRMRLKIWRGETAPAPEAFAYYSQAERGPALALGLVSNIVLFGSAFIWIIFEIDFLPDYISSVLKLLSLLIVFPMIWLILRLLLAPFLFINDNSRDIKTILIESYKRMKGKIGRIIGLLLSVAWWRALVVGAYLLVFFIIMVILIAAMFSSMIYLLVTIILSFVGYILLLPLICFLSAYPTFVYVAYMDTLVNSEEDPINHDL